MADRVRSGYYLASNGDATADLAAIGGRALTQYRSLADANILPGWKKPWITDLLTGKDTLINLVLELKYYGGTGSPGVPAPAMRIQRRDGTGVPAYGYDQVLAGQIDPLLDRALSQLMAMPQRHMVNIQWASELDTDHEFGTTEGRRIYTWAESDARAVAALKYVAGYWLDHGLDPAITMSVGMGGFSRPAFARMHPPSLAPHFGRLQWNAYRRTAAQRPYDVLNRTKAWAVADLCQAWLSKPVIVAEYGTPASLGSQSDWLAGVASAVQRMQDEGGPALEALCYFNSNPGWASLTPKAAGLTALAGQYARPPFTPAVAIR